MLEHATAAAPSTASQPTGAPSASASAPWHHSEPLALGPFDQQHYRAAQLPLAAAWPLGAAVVARGEHGQCMILATSFATPFST